MRARMNERGVIFLAISIVLLLLSILIRSPPLILVSSLALAYILGYPISIYSVNNPYIQLKATVRNSVIYRGEVEILQIEVINHTGSYFPILKLNFKLPLSVYLVEHSDERIFSTGPQEIIRFNIPFLPTMRGTYSIGPIVLKLGDPFLLFDQIIATKGNVEFEVYPKRIAKKVSKSKTREVFSALIGLFASRQRGIGTDFHGLRDYIRGDPVKIIDWKGSARSNKLISKEYEAEKRLEVLIGLAAGSTARGPKFDYMLGVAMDIYEGIIKQNFPAGLLLFDDDVIKEFMPSRSMKRKMQIWAETFDLEPSDVYPDYSVLSQWMEKKSLTGHLVIIIGDLEGDFDQTVDAIRDIRLRRNNCIFVDVWGYSFSFQQELKDAAADLASDNYGLILADVIGRELEQTQYFMGSTMKNQLIKHGSLYAYIENQDDNVIQSIERALFSHFGSQWKYKA